MGDERIPRDTIRAVYVDLEITMKTSVSHFMSPYDPRAQSNTLRETSLTIPYVFLGEFSIYQQLYKD